MKKVLLINPPRTISAEEGSLQRMAVLPPLGLMSIAAVLKQRGYSCEILNCLVENYYPPRILAEGYRRCGLTDKEIFSYIKENSPDIVGITIPLSIVKKDSLNIASIVKQVNKDIVVIMGGIHVTLFPEEIIKDRYVDYVVIGEGEYSFCELVQKLEKGVNKLNILGIGTKDAPVEHKVNRIENLDELPMPDYSLIDLEKYWKIRQPMGEVLKYKWVPYFSTRGCPYACTFCSAERIWGRKYRVKSSEKVLQELEKIIALGVEEIHFIDDNIFLDKKRTVEIFEKIIERFGKISWCAANGIAVNTLDEDIVKLMKQSGCFSAQISIESGNQYILDKVAKKPLNLNKVEKVVNLLRKYGLHTRGFFMLGFPGETKEQLEDTVKLIKKLKLDWVALNIVTPLPGTPLYDFARKENYLKKDYSFDDLRFLQQHMEYKNFSKDYLVNLWHELNEDVNFINNINLKEKKYDFAIYDFKRVAEVYPKHKLAHYYLAQAYKGKKNKEMFNKHLNIYNELVKSEIEANTQLL